MPAGSKPLGEVLVEERLISREQLSDAIKRQQETGRPIGKILLEITMSVDGHTPEPLRGLRPPKVDAMSATVLDTSMSPAVQAAAY